MSRSSGLFVLVFLSALVFPALALPAVLLAAALQMMSALIRLTARLRSGRPTERVGGRGGRSVFSVHLAIRNEPPDVVLRTIGALCGQVYPADRFEIIVIDNNTSDPALWQPVRDRTANMRLVSFYHFDQVDGAKAGALNIALERTAAHATHVVTIDADYVVEPDFLQRAECALEGGRHDYVQFPQAYARPAPAGGGLDLELADYFKTYARRASRDEAVLLTGTLSVIDRTALARVGGWSGATVTEDAELGLRLCLAGYSGRYVEDVVGRGMMPLTFDALAKQRLRWTAGNLRTLLHHHRRDALPAWRGTRSRQRLLILSQLLAWPNAALVPAASLLGSKYGPALAVPGTALRPMLEGLSSLTILLVFTTSVTSVVGAALRERWSFGDAARAVTTRLALVPVSARGAVEGALSRHIRFVVTPKIAARAGFAGGLCDHALLFAAAAVPLLWGQGPGLLPGLGCLALMSLLPLGLAAAADIKAYRISLTSQREGTA